VPLKRRMVLACVAIAVVLLVLTHTAPAQGLFDLAAVCRYHDLVRSQRRVLLDSWAGVVDGELLERLDAFCALYDLLVTLWEKAVASG